MIKPLALTLLFTLSCNLLLSVAVGATSLDDLDEDEREVDLTSVVVTALPCAQRTLKTGLFRHISNCSPVESIIGRVLFDVVERKIYLVDSKSIPNYKLDQAFGGGSVDIEGEITGFRDGFPVITAEEFTVIARPKPGAFKGCL